MIAGLKCAPGDVPERGDHHADRQAVGDRHADQRRVVDLVGGHDRADADEDQRERADELGDAAAQGVLEHGANLRSRPDGGSPVRARPFASVRPAGARRRGHTLRVMRRRVTFSRNLTLSLSRTCRCYCKYCAFATHTAHLYAPEEVLEILDGAARRQVKELLVLTGERPEVNPEVRARLRDYGHEDFTAICGVGVRARARAGPAAAHQPRRALARGPGAAARGDRLAGADARVGVRAADGRRSTRARRPSIRRGAWRRSGRPAS